MSTYAYSRAYNEDWDELKANIKSVSSHKEKWPDLIPIFEQISAQTAVFIMIWNVITSLIVYSVDKRNVCGYDASLYMAKNGMEFSVGNMHPESVYSIVTQQQKATKYFLKESTGDQDKTIVNLEGVYKKVTGKYFHFLQQSVCLETDNNGQPFLFLSYVYDVSHIKKKGTANLVITMPKQIKWWNFNYDTNRLEAVRLLSTQEKKILFCLAEGKSSKEIAKELFISSLTVDTHRKNLLKKQTVLIQRV